MESGLLAEIFTSPVNLVLICAITFLVYKLVKGHRTSRLEQAVEPELPKMRKKDFTSEELKKFDGTGPEGRVLIAINGSVFDVTRGKRFYGPDGPYSAFAGHDATRGLATFSITGNDGYDDLSDLNSMEMESAKEWEMQFHERYDYIGKLLKPGQEPTNYSDEEEEPSQQDTSERSKED
ncbi:hypothetical protein AAG570_003029 [Ranatra chinensis]|uniref:Cytochrome b5 heme-binding domain-containing protein n=1 Tax=Ranatra chinensis TaxID=642074 RepID=A0ABD0Y623_9HEMI